MASDTTLYTIGYEGRTAHEVVSIVVEAGATVLVDVRLTPISRKPGLSKTKLSDRLMGSDVVYLHEPDLGNPKSNRDRFRAGGDLEEGRRQFAAKLDNGSGQALERLVDLARTTSVAILCFERAAGRCHRDVIADRLRAADVAVIDL